MAKVGVAGPFRVGPHPTVGMFGFHSVSNILYIGRKPGETEVVFLETDKAPLETDAFFPRAIRKPSENRSRNRKVCFLETERTIILAACVAHRWCIDCLPSSR